MVLSLVLIFLFFMHMCHERNYSIYNPNKYDKETDLAVSKTYWGRE